MAEGKTLHIYLDPPVLSQAREGRHNFLTRVAAAVAPNWQIALHPDTPAERGRARQRKGWSLAHMTEAPGTRGATFRKAVHTPFWQIDDEAERWLWAVAEAPFDASRVDPGPARRFADFWRNRLYPGKIDHVSDEGYVFVPLQGRLLDHRPFQSMSPIEMLRTALDRLPHPIVARLHPRETYTADELAGLDSLLARYQQLSLSDRPALQLLAGCSRVVTENSALAFDGMLLGKPALLFARIDFHHAAASVPRDGLERGLAAFSDPPADFDAFVWWYWQAMSINAGKPDAEERIRIALRRTGMPI